MLDDKIKMSLSQFRGKVNMEDLILTNNPSASDKNETIDSKIEIKEKTRFMAIVIIFCLQ